ncbi:hypothetical protein E3N88_40299 [Mikania micrantha]|uniref:Uncharacterized protein n=1 Tax=Mikania micrantha TaxID=192012 RepID=A0A5N6LM76_9ASTR|nr:hypothetical protein E3N88_40299 [Mikania micrantha]
MIFLVSVPANNNNACGASLKLPSGGDAGRSCGWCAWGRVGFVVVTVGFRLVSAGRVGFRPATSVGATRIPVGLCAWGFPTGRSRFRGLGERWVEGEKENERSEKEKEGENERERERDRGREMIYLVVMSDRPAGRGERAVVVAVPAGGGGGDVYRLLERERESATVC